MMGFLRLATRLALLCAVCCGVSGDVASASASPPAGSSAFGARVFSVLAGPVHPKEWLTVALHPSGVPIRVEWESPGLEICPATTDGSAIGEGWPASSFVACLTGSAGHRVTLPATNGNFHVAFAVRNRSRDDAGVSLRVRYAAVDSFVAVVPPPDSEATVRFVAESTTIGVQPFELPSYAPPNGVRIVVRQGARTLTQTGECNFGSEIERCLQRIVPGRTVTVDLRRATATGDLVGIYLTWR